MLRDLICFLNNISHTLQLHPPLNSKLLNWVLLFFLIGGCCCCSVLSFLFLELGLKPRASHTQGQRFATEPPPTSGSPFLGAKDTTWARRLHTEAQGPPSGALLHPGIVAPAPGEAEDSGRAPESAWGGVPLGTAQPDAQ